MRRPSGRGIVALLLIGFMVTGCTRAVEVPTEQFESASQAHNMSHRINMNDGSRYAVDQFSLTDSTIVIEKWNLADERYKHVDLPMMVRRDDVKSIEELELDPGNSFWLLTSIGIGVVTLLVLFTPPGFD